MNSQFSKEEWRQVQAYIRFWISPSIYKNSEAFRNEVVATALEKYFRKHAGRPAKDKASMSHEARDGE